MTEVLRRSQREKRKPESIYEEAREALAELESEPWQASQEEEEEEEEDLEIAIKLKKAQKAKRMKKTKEGVNRNALFCACLESIIKKGKDRKQFIEASAEGLVEAFANNRGASELLGLLLLASGAEDDACVSGAETMQDIDWSAVEFALTAVVEQVDNTVQTSRPTISTAAFRAVLAEMIAAVIRQCGGRTKATSACAEASVAISQSHSSPGRRIGTVVALALASSAAYITEEASIEVKTAEQRLRSAKQAARSKGIQLTLDRARQRCACLKSARQAVLDGVVRKRWRDSRSEPRLACLEGLAAWARAQPFELLQDKTTKKIIAAPCVTQIAASALSFREAQERRAAAHVWSHLLLVADPEKDQNIQDALTRLATLAANDPVLSVRDAALDALLCAPHEAIALQGLFLTSCLRHNTLRTKALALALAADGVDLSQSEEDSATLLYRVSRATQDFSPADLVLAAVGGDCESILFDWDAYRRLLFRDDLTSDRARTVCHLLAAATEYRSSESSTSDSITILASGSALLARFADDQIATAALLRAVAASVSNTIDLEESDDKVSFEVLAKAIARSLETGTQRPMLDAAAEAMEALGKLSRRSPNTMHKIRGIMERLTGSVAMSAESSALGARRFARILSIDACPWKATASSAQRSLAAVLAASDHIDNLEALGNLRTHFVRRALEKEVDPLDPELAEYLGSLDAVGPALAAHLNEIAADDELEDEESDLLLRLGCNVLASGDPIFSFYDGLETLTLPSYNELASSVAKAIAVASRPTLEGLSALLLELAKRETLRASSFEEKENTPCYKYLVSPGLLVSAALNDSIDLLKNAFASLTPGIELILAAHERLAAATEDDDDALLVAAALLAGCGEDVQNAAVLKMGMKVHSSRSLLALESYVTSAAKIEQMPSLMPSQRYDDPYRARLVSRIHKATKKPKSKKNISKKKKATTQEADQSRSELTPVLSSSQQRERRAAKRRRGGSTSSRLSLSRASTLDKIIEDEAAEDNEDEPPPPAKRFSPTTAKDQPNTTASKRRIIMLSGESDETEPPPKRSVLSDNGDDDEYSEDSPMPMARQVMASSDDDTDLSPLAEAENEASSEDDSDSDDEPCPAPPQRRMSYDDDDYDM